jgi:hypothetical protein
MTDPAPLSLSIPAIRAKKVTGAFDGGAITSDAGVLLLGQAERRIGIVDRLAALIPDGRDPARVVHSLADILRARVLAIAAGYEDADDLDALRHDPAFKMALGKTPGEAVGLASQPTCSRWENAPDIRVLIRMGREMVGIYRASHDAPPDAVTLDIDDTFDAAHGQQQLTFWNGFHGEHGFAPIHVYETATGRPVAFILRPVRTPSGREVRGHVRRLIRRIRLHWPRTRITLRGDGHYARPEVMTWCEANDLDYIFGLPGNTVLKADTVIAATAFANVSRTMYGRIWTPPDCNILGSGSAVTIADVYPASLSGPECPSPRAPMDFRALLPQCPRDIGVRRAGPQIRFKKRWDRSLSPSLPGCCNVSGFTFVLSGPRPSRSAHRDGLLGPVVLLSRQNRPDDSGVLVGKGDGDHVGVSPFTHPADPQTFRIGFPVGFAVYCGTDLRQRFAPFTPPV